MSIEPPPRFVVRPVRAAHARRRRWLWLALAWIVSLLVVVAGMYVAADRGPLAAHDHLQNRQLQAQNKTLRQKNVNLTRSLQVAQVATRSLKDTLAEREEKIDGLRADLTFYSHLIGGGAQHHGLRVQDVHLTRVAGSRAWNVTVTLTHNVRRGSKVTGTVLIAVEGILKGHLTRLDWSTLSGQAARGGLDFGFRYFQQVRGTLMLPPDFTPNRLRIEAKSDKGQPVVRTIDWGTALKSVEDNDVQQ